MIEQPPGPGGPGQRMLKGFKFCDFPGDAAASRNRTIGRLIPSSVRHSRHLVSLDRRGFCCWSGLYVKAFETNFNRKQLIAWA